MILIASLPPLAEWDNFYVIVGSSAAALTGLMFVVIALISEADVSHDMSPLHAFATPTVVHFCAVLLISAFMSTPRQTTGSLRLCLGAAGIAGLAYVIAVFRRMRRQKGYTPDLEDWTWYGTLPVVAYAALFASAAILSRSPRAALYITEGVALLLLFIGIHNAWDSAVWMTTHRQKP